MIKVSVLYPRTANSHFDIEYYCSKHIPMVKALFGEACTATAVEEAISSTDEAEQQPFHAAGHLYFTSLAIFNQVFAAHEEVIMKDIDNYTNVDPVIQIGQVKPS